MVKSELVNMKTLVDTADIVCQRASSHTSQLFLGNFCLSHLQLLSRNNKARTFRNCHHGICILCRLQFLLKPCIIIDGFLETLELLF